MLRGIRRVNQPFQAHRTTCTGYGRVHGCSYTRSLASSQCLAIRLTTEINDLLESSRYSLLWFQQSVRRKVHQVRRKIDRLPEFSLRWDCGNNSIRESASSAPGPCYVSPQSEPPRRKSVRHWQTPQRPLWHGRCATSWSIGHRTSDRDWPLCSASTTGLAAYTGQLRTRVALTLEMRCTSISDFAVARNPVAESAAMACNAAALPKGLDQPFSKERDRSAMSDPTCR